MKKALKIIGITLGSVVGVSLIAVCIVVWFVFTPAKLTPIVKSYIPAFVSCQTELDTVDLTFFSTFPHFGLRLHNVALINPMDGAPSDTVAYIGDLVATVDVNEYLQNTKPIVNHSNIFDLHRKLKGEEDMSRLCYSYAKNAAQWQLFMEHFDSIKRNYEQYICDYNSSMEVVKDDDGNEITTSFPLTSLYTDNENYLRIANWVWRRKGGHERFSFDSEAEQEWAEVLKDVASDASKKLTIEQKDPELFEEATESTKILLWGKNYPYGSEIKFEYYLNGTHSSYPDFVLKDKKDRIHLFEVKSLNIKKGADINTEEYKAKVLALKNCYKHCSILTGQIFYLPIRDGETWKITRFLNGVEDTLTERQFESFIIDD